MFCGDNILLPGELPIYENFEETILSIKKLKQIENVEILLSSWDEPVYGTGILEKMEQSINYLLEIHEVSRGINNVHEYQPLELGKMVVEKMALPPAAINPLVARSFQSNLRSLASSKKFIFR